MTTNQARPESETERIVLDVWRDVFKITSLSSSDNIFELGVNSLDTMSMCVQLARIFQVEITPSSLLIMPTVADISAHIDSHRVA